MRPASRFRHRVRAWGLVVGLLPGGTAVAGDPASGQRIAERWCAACHLVSARQSTASVDVPSFEAIARSRELDRSRLSAFLADPHPRMPDMQLSRSEIDDLVGYIQTRLEQ
jgi:mono/diheme cytochrome c family protein